MPSTDEALPHTPVPQERRTLGFLDHAALWLSLGVGLLVLQSGALLVPLGLPAALAAIALGSAAGVALLGLAGVVGARTGLPAMATLRPALGERGIIIPALANIVQLVGWGAFELIVMRDSADAIGQRLGLPSAPLLWTLAWGGLATLMAWGGPLALVRRVLRRWGIWLVLGSALWLSFQLLASFDLSDLLAAPSDGSMAFPAALDLVIAMPLSWLPLIADYARFGRSPRGVFWGSALGYLLANVWFYALGAGYALALGGQALLPALLGASGGAVALALILFDESDNAFADLYSAAVSASTLLPQLPAPRLALAFGALSTALALLVPAASYESFLLLIGSVFAPLFAVVLCEHFLVRDAAPARAWGWRGIAAWLAGVLAYQLAGYAAPALGATLPSMLLAGLLYTALRWRWSVFSRPSAAAGEA
ncbi:putative hydroxymethylpyrimidine transporter CytX [Chloroflexia bacterium SDU3-3]|nr:putative hydroxymethylpyrimidine transporter CytX [Chloroflexia bacterium SDU3-3]